MPDTSETSPDASDPSTHQGDPSPDEALVIAVNIAKRYGWAVFPCRSDKRPACAHGFKDASCEASQIEALWDISPGPLIGLATGTVSGIWAVDVDVKHQEAIDWWHLAHPRLLPTKAYRTRSGGVHCYYRDGSGIGNTASKICKGVDTRGDGGYVIFWYAAGLECLDTAEPAPFPAWLRGLLEKPVRPVGRGSAGYQGNPDGGLRGLLDKVAGAAEGERNQLLFWAACRLFAKGLKGAEVEGLLVPIAVNTGLADPEARRTIASAERQA